ncbi:DUF4442 domain-containing protein [Parvicella tangerina]|uniref:DUF4442 domain-containing protein n=1 Tax=Parvicella tangerina TaxID=2829795 RepID=A0A916JLS9_9FLAO|nr:DUF4442 domain-containing protein [Parvicella tangerina]CAG5078262.1 hypothetical protein CRYO30217_00624 [Parvicella tangerina]
MKLKTKVLTKHIKLINYWPPFVGAGIKIKEVNQERTRFLISLRLTSRNRNLFGTQYGGSLYSMTDPFYAFILIMNMGNEYIVWDKSANIEFVKPGKGKVFVEIKISPERINTIKEEINEIGKSTYTFDTQILDEHQNVIANVSKEVYIRKKTYTPA